MHVAFGDGCTIWSAADVTVSGVDDDRPTYEYAEVVVGFVGRGFGNRGLTFMQVRDPTGDTMTPDCRLGPLEALNLMGAQGWQMMSERTAVADDRMDWICAELRRHDRAVERKNSEATQFLMMRRVFE